MLITHLAKKIKENHLMKIIHYQETINLKFISQCKLMINNNELFRSLTGDNAQTATPDNKKTLGE